MPLCDCLPGKYCGRNSPETVNASAQSLYIMFHSDELDAFKGFKAEWSSTYNGTEKTPGPPTIRSAARGKGGITWYFVKNCVVGNIFLRKAKPRRLKREREKKNWNKARKTVEGDRVY